MTETYSLEDTLARLSDRQRQKIEELINQRALLIAALREIEKDGGPYSKAHPFEHACSIIWTMKDLAREALSKI